MPIVNIDVISGGVRDGGSVVYSARE